MPPWLTDWLATSPTASPPPPQSTFLVITLAEHSRAKRILYNYVLDQKFRFFFPHSAITYSRDASTVSNSLPSVQEEVCTMDKISLSCCL